VILSPLPPPAEPKLCRASLPCLPGRCRGDSDKIVQVVVLPDSGWVVVMPVKTLALAKTRLVDLPPGQRAELALAMAIDAAEAVLAASGVVHGLVVVTSDPFVSADVVDLSPDRVLVVDDAASKGLNDAARLGIAAAARWRPGRGVAVMTADLPALRSEELAAVLAMSVADEVIAVADTEGSGTTMLASRASSAIVPRFGIASFARHVSAGARGLDVVVGPGLRRDVDRLRDLDAARALGVGRRTAALSHIGPPDMRRGPASAAHTVETGPRSER
jgi:2-phospho-L-lactate guanylyltransferase